MWISFVLAYYGEDDEGVIEEEDELKIIEGF
jgi:hypothetical protein